MSISRGLLRIVLLRSGGYDYAELELQTPIHLVAGNNVGKTTLIAALQFLYIDDSRQMHFAHDWRKTKQHYFPDSGSFILFECMTPTGLQVFGLRGQGPVQGFDYDRFGYNGAYERDDFLDDRTPRPWNEVSARLLTRELRQMEPRHLRASLTGAGDARRPPLGLVPLKRSGSYDSFRFLFRNLLRLSRIEQKQLKNLFIDISRPRLGKVEIDIRRDYSEMFARVEKDAQDVEALRVVAPAIRELVSGFAERERLRGSLVATWRHIEQLLEAERLRVREALRALEEQRAQVRTSLEQVSKQQETLQERVQALGKQEGVLSETLKQLAELEARVKGYVPELEEAGRRRFQAQLDGLITRLAGAARAGRGATEKELTNLRRKQKGDELLLSRFSEALVTWLRRHSGLEDSELADVFAVSNPTLLGEVVGGGRLQIDDASRTVSLVRAIAGAFDEAGFAAHGVRVARAADSPLSDYQDIDVVRERVAHQGARIAELEQLLADLREQEQLEAARAKAEKELGRAKERERNWKEWKRRAPERALLQDQLKDLELQSSGLHEEQKDLQVRWAALTVSESRLQDESKSLRATLQRQVQEVQRLVSPPSSWSEAELTGDLELELDPLLRTYRAEFSRHQKMDAELQHRFATVEHQTAGRHQGGDERETIARLQDELAALDQRQTAVQELWTSLVDGMQKAFKDLLDAVDEVRREVTRLTMALNRRQVSNLERVELKLVKQRDLLARLKAVIEAEESPLFAGAGGRSKAARDVRTWLESRPRLELAELFDLQFSIVDVRGQTKRFNSLSQIESQGTSTTIKVLVHLELLRSMLADNDVAVPFFLDEVATLDEPNLRALIHHATGMGFVPVVASPEPRDCVETLYFLRRGEGGLVLDETSRVRLIRDEPSAS